MTRFLAIETSLLFWAIFCRMTLLSATVADNGHSSVTNEGIEITHFKSIARGFARNVYEDRSPAISPVGHVPIAIPGLDPGDPPSQHKSLLLQIPFYGFIAIGEGESPYCQPGALKLSVSGMT